MRFGNSDRMCAAAGCVAVLFVAQALLGQQTKEKVTVDDVDRNFVIRLPKGYDAQQHYPVVILLHGMNQDADDMQRLTRFDELADKDGIITIYPVALHGRWNTGVHPQERRPMTMGPGRRGRYGGGGYPGGGYPGGGYPGGGGQRPQGREPGEDRRPAPADDIGFFNQMLDQVGSKVFGGFVTNLCGGAVRRRFHEHATGMRPERSDCGGSCGWRGDAEDDDLPAVASGAACMVNGTSDPVVPYGGGTEHNMNVAVISVEDSAKAWAKIDRCEEKPEKSKLPAHAKGGMETKVDTYNGCQQSAQVVLYSVKGAGNTWPGGEQYEAEKTIGKTSQDLNANEVHVEFLRDSETGYAKRRTEVRI